MSRYQWVPSWAELPPAPRGWMHSGIALLDGEIVVAHAGEPTLLWYGEGGDLRRSVPVPGLLELHGFEVVPDGLWIADIGSKRRPRGAEFETRRGDGRVVLVDRDGAIRRELHDPGRGWSPTAVAHVAESGDLWVADGYGQQLVHRFDAAGRHLLTLSGEEGAGRFSCPHCVAVDRRRGDPELYVADRANGRLQVYDLEGRFRRVAGAGVLVTPADLAFVREQLVLTDYTRARLTILDGDDTFVEHVGEDPQAPTRDGWPNARDQRGDLVPPPLVPGRFNSPHTLAADGGGDLYVTEWLLGGRLTKWQRVAA
ncbi:MAG TPA: hypothetical protein VFA88_00765 [Gaiellaceae bacterium]|nr:hypothetical protein [Gaiellaceae bacterium]